MENPKINQIKCPRCKSISIKKEECEQDFAARKNEGEPANKSREKLFCSYFCLDCSCRWQEDN